MAFQATRYFLTKARNGLATALFAATLLSACQEMKAEKPKLPHRDISSTKSTVSGTGGEVGLAHTVSVRIVDAKGNGIYKVTPSVSAVDGSGNAVAGISNSACAPTDGWGRTTCSITSSVPGTFTLKVTAPTPFTGGSITFTQITRSLEFSTQPSALNTSATVFGTQPVVRLLDRAGNLNVSGTETVTLSLTTPNGATLGGTVAVAAVAGVATFTNLQVNLAGTYTLTATSGTMTRASESFTVQAGAATRVGFVTQPSSQNSANNNFSQQPVVAVQDAAGNTVTTASCVILLTLTSSPNVGDNLLGTVSRTAVSGLATYTDLRISTPNGGTGYQLTATPQGACGAYTPATSSLFEITREGVPSQIALVQSPSTAALNQEWPTQPVLHVLDDDGNLVGNDNGTSVTIAITSGPGGVLTGPTSIQAVNGVVTFAGLNTGSTDPSHAGTYNLQFTATNSSVPGFSAAPVNFTQTITDHGLVGTQLRFVTQPAGVSINQPLPPFEVEITDSNGYRCMLCEDTVTLSFSAGSGAMVGVLNQDAVAGKATFSGHTFNTAGAKQLRVDAGGMTHAFSSIFTVSSYGTASRLTFGTQPASGGSTGQTPWATQPTVRVEDSAGNLVVNNNGTPITLSCASWSGGSACNVNGTNPVNTVNGVATFTDLRTQETGLNSIVLQAGASGLLSTQSNAFAGNSAVPVRVDIANTVSTSATGTNSWTNQPIVHILDANNQIITTDNTTSVTITIHSFSGGGSATLLGTATRTAVGGVVSFTDLRTSETGLTNIVLRAASAGLIDDYSNAFTGNAP